MTAIQCRSAASIDFDLFTAAFNLAYSDYFMPIVMTPPAFRALIERDDIDLTESVAALDGDTIVGTGLLGIRSRLGWIGGMGVIPNKRRQGIGRQMMHFLLDRARQRALGYIDLEVLEANEGAAGLYRELGFEEQRHLLTLDRVPASVDKPLPDTLRIENQPGDAVLEYYAAFHDSPNCWQRALPSLQALAPHVQSWVVIEADQVSGYAMGWANDIGVRLLDFATSPRSDRGTVAHALLSHLHQQNPTAYGNSYNIAENDPALPAFLELGYTIAFRQIEMRIALPPG